MVHNIFGTEPDHKNTENPKDPNEVDDKTNGAFAQVECIPPPVMSCENVTSNKLILRHVDDTLAPAKARKFVIQKTSAHGVELLRASQLIPADLVRAKKHARLQRKLYGLNIFKPCFVDFLPDHDNELVDFVYLALSHCAMKNFKLQGQQIKSLVRQDAEYRSLSMHDPHKNSVISYIQREDIWRKEICRKYFEHLTLTRSRSIPRSRSPFISGPYITDFAGAQYGITSDGLIEIYFPLATQWVDLQPHRVIDPGRIKTILAKISSFIPPKYKALEQSMHLIGCNHNFAVFLINNDQYACELPSTITEKPKIWHILSEKWQEIDIDEQYWSAYRDSFANKHKQQMQDKKTHSLLHFRVCHPIDNFLGVEEYAMEIKSVGDQDARSIWSN
jgi:hypothetical protein